MNYNIIKMKYIHIPPDGNCLFNSISYGIRKDFKHGPTLRKCAVDYVKKNPSYKDFIYDRDFNTYLRQMSSLGTYGDELMITALVNVFDIKINVYNKNDGTLINQYYNKNVTIKKIINLCYDNIIQHYDYLVEL